MEPLDHETQEALRRLRTRVFAARPSPAVEQALRAETVRLGKRPVSRPMAYLALAASLLIGAAGWILASRTNSPSPNSSSAIPVEAVTAGSGFIAVRESSLLPPPADPRILRVSVPRATLTSLGVRLPQRGGSRVLADILVGEDGLTRAVRLVQN